MQADLKGASVLTDVPLSLYTTIQIGGNADYLIKAYTVEQIVATLSWAQIESLPVFVLGGGSNVLISDDGWPGIVLMPMLQDVSVESQLENHKLVKAGSGVIWDDFVGTTVELGLQGVECLSGIPGSVGAAPIQNIGAYGQEVKDTIEWVEVLDRQTLQIERYSNAKCDFSYRHSRFKAQDKDKKIVLWVCFKLKENAPPTARYGDLVRYFEGHGIQIPTLYDMRNAVISIRRTKGMVTDPADVDSKSCGSFFMNPILSEANAIRVRETAVKEDIVKSPDEMPFFPQKDGTVKLSAAWLIEKTGIQRGFAIHNAGVSSKHVLALVNRGGATFEEVNTLAKFVRQRVFDRFGVRLSPEPIFVNSRTNPSS